MISCSWFPTGEGALSQPTDSTRSSSTASIKHNPAKLGLGSLSKQVKTPFSFQQVALVRSAITPLDPDLGVSESKLASREPRAEIFQCVSFAVIYCQRAEAAIAAKR
jgi:hypothetical protein